MSQICEGNVKAFTAGEDLVAYRRVKLSEGTVVYADSGNDWIGTTEEAVSSGYSVSVRLRTASGTRKIMAAGAFSAGALLYGADDGKVDDTVAGQPIFRALEEATANGDIVEVITEEGVSLAVNSLIWVSPDGDDSGDGSLSSPLLTITAVLAAVTASRKTIMLLPGNYPELLSLAWPSITGISINGMLGQSDGVTIAGTTGQTEVIEIDPTVQTATFEATISNLTISAPTGVNGITFDNTNVGRKINLYLHNVAIENQTETDKAINVVHTTAGNAMRIYANGSRNIVEGLLYIAPKNTDDRFNFTGLQFDGGVQFGTTTIASVSTFKDCIMKDAGGAGGQDTQILVSMGCYSLTGTTYAAAALGDFAANAAEVIL
jgi:hypothetical protein